jgi:hypothetical protein
MKNIKLPATLFAITILLLLFSNCKKDTRHPEPDPNPSYTVPTSYHFTNANFTSSTQRIAMLEELTTYIKTAHTPTSSPTLSAQKLMDMFVNNANPFIDADLNSSGIELKNQTNNNFGLYAEIENAFAEIANVSVSTPSASNGVAGKLISGSKAYLVNEKGIEFKEVIDKGIMGALLYNRATTLLNNIGSYDNSTVVAGIGTAQEHAWDEAFGYFGVPVTFPTNTVGLKNWGNYCNAVNAAIGSNTLIMNAFLKGRAAITNKDIAGRDAARNIICAAWEKVCAARFITYMKNAKNNIADDAIRIHNLTESLGFVKAFKYNSTKSISNEQINQLLNYLGDNFYAITQSNIENAISTMAGIFALDANAL